MELFSGYIKKDWFLSRIDARVKLLVCLAILVMVLSYKGFALPLLVASICLFLCMGMKIPLKAFLLRFSEPVFIAVIIILLKMLFSGGQVIFSISIPTSHFSLFTLTGYKDGLIDGLMIATRIIGAVSIIAVMGFSTSFIEFIAGLSWLRIPRGFIEILMFAYRYIFVLFEDAMVIYNAQKNRLGYSSIRRGIGSFGILTGSLILKTFEHSHNITVSMIQRGYDGNVPILKHKPFRVVDIVVSAIIVIAIGIVWKI